MAVNRRGEDDWRGGNPPSPLPSCIVPVTPPLAFPSLEQKLMFRQGSVQKGKSKRLSLDNSQHSKTLFENLTGTYDTT